MKQYRVISPDGSHHHILAADQWEAIHKAKRIDGHIYENSKYLVYEHTVYTALNKKR